VWDSGEGRYVSCGIVGRQVCIVWHSGEDGYVSCGMGGRTGMYCVA